MPRQPLTRPSYSFPQHVCASAQRGTGGSLLAARLHDLVSSNSECTPPSLIAMPCSLFLQYSQQMPFLPPQMGRGFYSHNDLVARETIFFKFGGCI